MAKNMTRKGLALGSGVALLASGFVALPASAAGELATTLSAGTSFNSVTGYNNLVLKTTIDADYAAIDGTLKYRVINAGLVSVDVLAGTTSGSLVRMDNTDGELNEYTKNVDLADSDSVQTGLQTNDNDFVVDLVAGSFSGGVGLYTANNFLSLGVADGTTTDYTLTVQAWLDQNGDNVIDATEKAGPVVTLNFYDETNIAAVTSMVAPVTGASSVSATFTTTPELNGEQLGADFFDVSFTAQGNTNAVMASKTSSDAAVTPTLGTTTYSGITKTWTSTAYLAYSKASDAWNGTNGSIDGIADLTDNNGATAGATPVTLAISSNVATFASFPHGLGASNAGSFVARISGLTSTTANTSALAGLGAVTIVDANSFTMPLTGTNQANTDVVTAGVASLWSVGANSGAVVASGTYSATPYLGATKLGALASTGASATTANDTKATIVGSVNVEGAYNEDGSSETAVAIRKGTTSVTVTATIYYADANSVQRVAPAGVPVTGYLNESAGGTFQINSAGAGVTSDVELTDANGQVTFVVTSSTAANGNGIDLDIRPQSLADDANTTAEFDLNWVDADYELFDMKNNRSQPASSTLSYRSIDAAGSYTFDFALLDQWGQPAPDASYRLQVINADRTVSSSFHNLSNGRASVTVADGAQSAATYITTTVNVQKLTSGTWGTVAADSWNGSNNGRVQINVVAAQTDAIVLDATGAQLYEYDNSASVNAIFVADIALEATEAQDRRSSAVAQPAYDGTDVDGGSATETIVLHGRVTNNLTAAARGGQIVTVTGDSSILFSDGHVDAFGSLSVVTSDEGDFTILAYSNKAQKDSVLTFTTSSGASKTQKVTFSPVSKVEGTTVTISAPASAASGSTYSVTVKVTDKYGNAVNTGTNDQLSITYSGPGIVFGTLPDDTNALGEASFAVLLGTNDSGTATITAVLDKSDNGSFTDATGAVATDDIATSATVTIGTAGNTGAYSSWTKKLDDNSAKIYAKNVVGAGKVQFFLNGREIAWVRATSAADPKLRTANGSAYLVRTVEFAEGKNVLEVYLDGVRQTRTAYTK